MAQNVAKNINSIGKSSSYWLVSAYTSVAGSGNDSDTNLDFGNDYFKISSLTGIPGTSNNPPSNGVPEPSSLVLLVGGLMGWRLTRTNATNSQSDYRITA
jgi:hypothetical protein